MPGWFGSGGAPSNNPAFTGVSSFPGGTSIDGAGNVVDNQALTVRLGAGVWGHAAPGAQPAAIAAPIATASTNVTPYGFATAAQADAVVTAVRAIIPALQGMGITL